MPQVYFPGSGGQGAMPAAGGVTDPMDVLTLRQATTNDMIHQVR
jgi:hypothetical protein